MKVIALGIILITIGIIGLYGSTSLIQDKWWDLTFEMKLAFGGLAILGWVIAHLRIKSKVRKN